MRALAVILLAAQIITIQSDKLIMVDQDYISDPQWENPAFFTFYQHMFQDLDFKHCWKPRSNETLLDPNIFMYDKFKFSYPSMLDLQSECIKYIVPKCNIQDKYNYQQDEGNEKRQRQDKMPTCDTSEDDENILIKMRKPIYIHNERHYPSDDFISAFPGTFILFSGESPDPTSHPNRINNVEYLDKTIVLGHHAPETTQAKSTIWLPMASFIFAFLNSYSPLDLLNVNRNVPLPGEPFSQPYFAAYFASSCLPWREKIYNDLVDFAARHYLGKVTAFGACYGSHPETRNNSIVRSVPDMYYKNLQIQKQYRFVLALENAHLPYYIDQKITIAFLAGSIPIYSGGDSVFKLFNRDAFLFMRPTQLIDDILWPLLSNPNREIAMRKAPILASQEHNVGFDSLYVFSWHKDVDSQFYKGTNMPSIRGHAIRGHAGPL